MAAPDCYISGIIAGTTALSVDVILRGSEDNQGVTGITPGQVIADFAREDEAPVPFNCVAGSLTSFVERGWVAYDATRHRGWYRLGLPNAALSAGPPQRNYVMIALDVNGTFGFRLQLPLISARAHTKRFARLTIPEILADGPLDGYSIAALTCGLRRFEFADIGGTRYLVVRDSNNAVVFQEPVGSIGEPFVQITRTGPPVA